MREISEFSLTSSFDFTKSSEPIQETILDKKALEFIKKLIIENQTEDIEKQSDDSLLSQYSIILEKFSNKIAEAFWNSCPQILLFNDFSTLLPDKILISDLENPSIQGQKAVKNLEVLLKYKFAEIAEKNIPQKQSTSLSESQKISANFQDDWQQKIFGDNEVNIKFYIEKNDSGNKEISFFIETKDNELLSPKERSKGMIWFLSLWLELKAKENNRNLLLLFDEPGHHLHIKANKDMLLVFHKLANKGHQIIYSTHSPSLIEVDNLQNIGLVINNKKEGTLVEGLTTSKINTKNKKDALQPISEAMGLDPFNTFSVINEKNVIVEGLSDYWYLSGFRKLLNREQNYYFVPSIGIKGNKVFPLISFCIGYGVDWLLIMENGDVPIQTRNELRESLFSSYEFETNKRIKIIQYKEIENIFTVNDLRLIDEKISVKETKEPVQIIGKSRKIIFAKLFIEKIETGEISIEQINPQTIQRFTEIFDWIDERFSM